MADPLTFRPCVVQPADLDWSAQPNEVVQNGAANGIREALAEALKRTGSRR